MIAGVICFRLYTVLGRRTGHEPPPQPVPAPLPASRPQPAPEPAASDFQRTAGHPAGRPQPSTRPNSSPAPARLMPASSPLSPRATVRNCGCCLSPDVFAAFDAGITARTAPAPDFVKLHDARIVGSGCMAARRRSRSPSRQISQPERSPMSGPSSATWAPPIQLDPGGDLGRTA